MYLSPELSYERIITEKEEGKIMRDEKELFL
jgi:hypothetical protein